MRPCMLGFGDLIFFVCCPKVDLKWATVVGSFWCGCFVSYSVDDDEVDEEFLKK